MVSSAFFCLLLATAALSGAQKCDTVNRNDCYDDSDPAALLQNKVKVTEGAIQSTGTGYGSDGTVAEEREVKPEEDDDDDDDGNDDDDDDGDDVEDVVELVEQESEDKEDIVDDDRFADEEIYKCWIQAAGDLPYHRRRRCDSFKIVNMTGELPVITLPLHAHLVPNMNITSNRSSIPGVDLDNYLTPEDVQYIFDHPKGPNAVYKQAGFQFTLKISTHPCVGLGTCNAQPTPTRYGTYTHTQAKDILSELPIKSELSIDAIHSQLPQDAMNHSEFHAWFIPLMRSSGGGGANQAKPGRGYTLYGLWRVLDGVMVKKDLRTLAEVLTHEIGHGLQLGHTAKSQKQFFWRLMGANGRQLTECDVGNIRNQANIGVTRCARRRSGTWLYNSPLVDTPTFKSFRDEVKAVVLSERRRRTPPPCCIPGTTTVAPADYDGECGDCKRFESSPMVDCHVQPDSLKEGCDCRRRRNRGCQIEPGKKKALCSTLTCPSGKRLVSNAANVPCWGTTCDNFKDFHCCEAMCVCSVKMSTSAAPFTTAAPALLPLSDLGRSGCGTTHPCGPCEGDCDFDAHCKPGLKCLQRDADSPHHLVEGCSPGGAGDVAGHDYCYDPGVKYFEASGIGAWMDVLDTLVRGQVSRIEVTGDCVLTVSNEEVGSKTTNLGLKAGETVQVLGTYHGPGQWDFSSGNLTTGDNNIMSVRLDCPGSLQALGRSHCTDSAPCGECQGDCDSDSDCGPGLKCFLRTTSQEIVPGCIKGGFGDIGNWDYCYDPANAPPATTAAPGVLPALKDLQVLPPRSSGCNDEQCGACQGDCDKDDHCEGHLKCFQRNGFDPVPGCNAGGVGDKKDYDYCYDPTQWAMLENLGGSGCNGEPCDACQGDCDKDSHCKGDLKCYQRNAYEAVPGCHSGGGGDKRGYDYCYDPAEETTA